MPRTQATLPFCYMITRKHPKQRPLHCSWPHCKPAVLALLQNRSVLSENEQEHDHQTHKALSIIVYKPVALSIRVKSICPSRLCRNYMSGNFGVPFSAAAPAFVSITQHSSDDLALQCIARQSIVMPGLTLHSAANGPVQDMSHAFTPEP